jgi:flagellar M-ring protein FliF
VGEVGQFPFFGGGAWRNATPAQRIGVGAFALICVGLVALTVSLGRRPQFAVLYANLEPEDAAAVVQQLRELKLPYRVSPRGTVETPADRIDEIRLDLAAEGIPSGGQAGFELFDRSRVGLSDFGEQLNYQRALQGEIARTIAHLEPVTEARVHIAFPRERLYSSQQEKPTASVVLNLRTGGGLNPQQVRSIVHLVSGAVEGLEPESVTILDSSGRLLANRDDSGLPGAGLAAASTQLQLQRDYERQVEGAVQSMLDQVLGPGKAVVRASASLDLAHVETESESFEPAAEGAGVLESRQENREIYRGSGESTALGIPGVTSNSGRPQPAAQKAPGSDHYEQTEVTSQYRVSRQVERRIQPPGQVRQLSLSVFVDQETDLGEVEDLTGAVTAAAGLNPDRGDRVVITRLPFQPPAAEQKGSKVYAIRDFYFRVGRDFAALLLLALFLHFVHRLLRRPRLAQPTPEPAPEPARAATPQPASEDLERGTSVLRAWLSSAQRQGGDGETAAAAPDETAPDRAAADVGAS